MWLGCWEIYFAVHIKIGKVMIKYIKITWNIVYLTFTDPMTEHRIDWNDRGDVWVTHGRTWSMEEVFNHWFGRK